MKINIYCDRNSHPKGTEHVEMLVPLWGTNNEQHAPLQTGRYDRLFEAGARFFEPVPIESADLCVLSIPWKYTLTNTAVRHAADSFLQRCAGANKPVVVFFSGPHDDEIPISDSSLLFRSSLYRTRRKHNEFAMPSWGQDLLTKYNGAQINFRCKNGKPTVGFCGYAPPLGLPWGLRRIKESLRAASAACGLLSLAPNHIGHSIRARALTALMRSRAVRTNFIVRPDLSFSGTGAVMGGASFQVATSFQREFYQNTIDSDYVVCARGFGNNSIRLYEALCCGRIPVFIDTDCVLPYDFEIDWKKYCVWVDESELPQLGEKIADFHAGLSHTGFLDLQRACRKLWEEWLAPEAFFAHFRRHLARVKTPAPSG